MRNPTKEYYYSEVTKAINLENVRQFTPRAMLRSASYYYISVSTFASAAAYLVIVPFISTIAVSRGMSQTAALAAVMCTGAANAAGRILAPIVSDRIGRSRTVIACAVISAGACLLVIGAKGYPYIAAVSLIAMSYGGSGSVNPVITTELFGARYSGANYGLVLLSIAFASLFFSRASAVLAVGGDYTPMFIICAAACVVPVAMMTLLRRRCRRLGKEIRPIPATASIVRKALKRLARMRLVVQYDTFRWISHFGGFHISVNFTLDIARVFGILNARGAPKTGTPPRV